MQANIGIPPAHPCGQWPHPRELAQFLGISSTSAPRAVNPFQRLAFAALWVTPASVRMLPYSGIHTSTCPALQRKLQILDRVPTCLDTQAAAHGIQRSVIALRREVGQAVHQGPLLANVWGGAEGDRPIDASPSSDSGACHDVDSCIVEQGLILMAVWLRLGLP